MNKITATSLACVAMLSGCYSVPDTPDFEVVVSGNYQAVSDCAWMKLRTMEAWDKDDLPSMQKVEFSFTNGTSTAARIDVAALGAGRTKVTSYMPKAIWGKDFWPSRMRPIFEKCSQ